MEEYLHYLMRPKGIVQLALMGIALFGVFLMWVNIKYEDEIYEARKKKFGPKD